MVVIEKELGSNLKTIVKYKVELKSPFSGFYDKEGHDVRRTRIKYIVFIY